MIMLLMTVFMDWTMGEWFEGNTSSYSSALASFGVLLTLHANHLVFFFKFRIRGIQSATLTTVGFVETEVSLIS
jgi:hypothetical protein